VIWWRPGTAVGSTGELRCCLGTQVVGMSRWLLRATNCDWLQCEDVMCEPAVVHSRADVAVGGGLSGCDCLQVRGVTCSGRKTLGLLCTNEGFHVGAIGVRKDEVDWQSSFPSFVCGRIADPAHQPDLLGSPPVECAGTNKRDVRSETPMHPTALEADENDPWMMPISSAASCNPRRSSFQEVISETEPPLSPRKSSKTWPSFFRQGFNY
jgi:hypothetical protein